MQSIYLKPALVALHKMRPIPCYPTSHLPYNISRVFQQIPEMGRWMNTSSNSSHLTANRGTSPLGRWRLEMRAKCEKSHAWIYPFLYLQFSNTDQLCLVVLLFYRKEKNGL